MPAPSGLCAFLHVQGTGREPVCSSEVYKGRQNSNESKHRASLPKGRGGKGHSYGICGALASALAQNCEETHLPVQSRGSKGDPTGASRCRADLSAPFSRVRQPSGLSRKAGTCLAGRPCERQGLWQEATAAWPPASQHGSPRQGPADPPPRTRSLAVHHTCA